MKAVPLTACVLLALATRLGMLAQGQFLPHNYSATGFPAPFVAVVTDRDGITPLGGADYSVQYYGGPLGNEDQSLAPLLPVISLESQAGIFGGEPVTVPGVPAGQRARLQLRVWDNEGGTKPTWESATIRGASIAFDSQRLTAVTAPTGMTATTHGLTPTQLLPALNYRGVSPGRCQMLYQNSFYQGLTYRPPSYSFQGMAGDGHAVFYSVVPGTNPESFIGPVEVRRRRFGTEQSLHSPAPPPVEWDQWQFAGVSDDGLTVAANFWDGTRHTPLLLRGGLTRPLPGALARHLSGDGRYVLLQGNAGELHRFDWRTGATRELRGPNSGEPFLALLSRDGQVALLRDRLWREAGDEIPLPSTFVARQLSGDGWTVVGQANERPAYWTQPQGVVVLHKGEPETRGALNDCSFDGEVLGGQVTTRRGQFQIWRRNGSAHRLVELLPWGANQSLAPFARVEVTRVSRDGRTVFATGKNYQWLFAGAVTPTDAGLVADLVFPDDGAHVTLNPGAGPGGTDRISLPAPKGYRFQLELSSSLATWKPAGDAVPGNGTALTFDLPADGNAGFYRVQNSPE